MAQDWGQQLGVALYADSSAALAIAKRKGAGKAKHINVSALWIQDTQDRESAQYMKRLGTEIPADMVTKHQTRDKMDACMQTIGQGIGQGRDKRGLDIQGASTQ